MSLAHSWIVRQCLESLPVVPRGSGPFQLCDQLPLLNREHVSDSDHLRALRVRRHRCHRGHDTETYPVNVLAGR